MKYLLILVILILLFTNILSAQEDFGYKSYERKNPFLAGIFSWYHPGLGQFYVGETTKAAVFWITENILLFATILNIADIKIGFKKDFGFEFAIRLKKNPSKTRIATTVGLGILFVAVHIINIIDAIQSAQEYNRQLFAREFETSQRNFSIEGVATNNYNGLQVVGRF